MRCDRSHRFDPWVRKIPWRRQWPPTSGFLPGKSLWTEEPGRLQSVGLQRVRHRLVTKQWQQCTYTHWYTYTNTQIYKHIHIHINIHIDIHICIYIYNAHIYIYIHTHIMIVKVKCPTLCEPLDCSPPGSSVHGISRHELWSGLPFPSPGDLPDPGIEPGSPAL